MPSSVMETIDALQVTQFSDSLHEKAQQKMARFRPYCETKKMTGDIWAYDGIGTVEARTLVGRYNPTVFSDIEHTRRKIARTRFEITIPIDQYDLDGMITDPQGKYADAIVAAMERQVDTTIYQAAFAAVLTGRDMSTSVSAATDGVLTVTATGGMVLDDLCTIQENWIDYEVDESKRKMLTITGDENSELLQITALTSGDFTRYELGLDKGTLVRAVGMDLVKFGMNGSRPIIQLNSTPNKELVALAEGGICLAISRDFDIKVERRPDYVDTWQMQCSGSIGAVRTEGILVQKVLATP